MYSVYITVTLQDYPAKSFHLEWLTNSETLNELTACSLFSRNMYLDAINLHLCLKPVYLTATGSKSPDSVVNK